MRKQKYFRPCNILFLGFLTIMSSVSSVSAQADTSLHLKVTEMTEASAPVIINDSILLTYKPTTPVRFVGAAFSHENFMKVHPYSYNERGVYFLVIPVPKTETVRYRIIVDGLWMRDPSTPARVRDTAGLYLSVIPVPADLREEAKNGPVVLSDGRVRFTFIGEPGSRVSVAGDFNNWDPFMFFLDESSPGIFTLTVRMAPGRYNYYFFYDGNRVPDPLNSVRLTLQNGIEVSALLVPPSS